MQVQGHIYRYSKKIFLSTSVGTYDAANFEEFLNKEVYAEVFIYDPPQIITIGDDFGEIAGYVVNVKDKI